MRYSRLGYWGLQTLAMVLMLAVAAFVMWVLPPQMVVIKTGLVAIALVAAFALGFLCYRSADEVILQTHKTCWFWGSFAAILVAALAIMAVLIGAIPMPNVLHSSLHRPEDIFADGVVFVVLLQAGGFAIVWAYQNFARRP